MRAFLTSIGEPTTDLAQWALERNGFQVSLIQGSSPLHEKLSQIYHKATDDFLRVDADTIVSRLCTPDQLVMPPETWWLQYQTFDMYKLDVMWGGVQFITKKALPALRANIGQLKHPERPETEMFRLPDFHNPRRCISEYTIMGLHGFAQKDLTRVRATKLARDQMDDYDWQMAERLEKFYV